MKMSPVFRYRGPGTIRRARRSAWPISGSPGISPPVGRRSATSPTTAASTRPPVRPPARRPRRDGRSRSFFRLLFPGPLRPLERRGHHEDELPLRHDLVLDESRHPGLSDRALQARELGPGDEPVPGTNQRYRSSFCQSNIDISYEKSAGTVYYRHKCYQHVRYEQHQQCTDNGIISEFHLDRFKY